MRRSLEVNRVLHEAEAAAKRHERVAVEVARGVRRRERRVPRPRRRRTRSSRRRGSRTQSPPGVGSTGTCEAPHRTRGSAGRGGRRDAPGNARRRPHPTPCAAASRRTRTARTSCGGPRGGRAQLRKGFMEWGNLESALSSEPPRGARASCSWKKTTRCSHSTAGSPTGAASTRTRTSGGVGGRGAAARRHRSSARRDGRRGAWPGAIPGLRRLPDREGVLRPRAVVRGFR